MKYKLVISSRDKLELFRGNISCDCTAFKNGPSFSETIPQHLLDPGFINMRLFENNKWVGNVYLLVVEINNKPVLIIDAIQTSLIHNWFIPEVVVAEKIISVMRKYVKKYGFWKTYLSKFTSNRSKIYAHFRTYSHIQAYLHKTAGFDHLKQLNLWDAQNFRNEYIETFSCGGYNLEDQWITLIEI